MKLDLDFGTTTAWLLTVAGLGILVASVWMAFREKGKGGLEFLATGVFGVVGLVALFFILKKAGPTYLLAPYVMVVAIAWVERVMLGHPGFFAKLLYGAVVLSVLAFIGSQIWAAVKTEVEGLTAVTETGEPSREVVTKEAHVAAVERAAELGYEEGTRTRGAPAAVDLLIDGKPPLIQQKILVEPGKPPLPWPPRNAAEATQGMSARIWVVCGTSCALHCREAAEVPLEIGFFVPGLAPGKGSPIRIPPEELIRPEGHTFFTTTYSGWLVLRNRGNRAVDVVIRESAESARQAQQRLGRAARWLNM